ncbi:hypothetical protein U91I_03548 [alpha proteobacterium U9-1i]|nr:hypothetical protein U91I_03548 [alpha proteobacterium U9-1i]
MLRLVTFVIALSLSALSIEPAQAQTAQAAHRGPDLAAQRAAMARLSGMIGDWTGEVAVTFPAARTVHQVEHIESEMDGLLLVIRGNGFAEATHTGAPIFQAFGVISYNEQRQVYEFRVYNDGRAATAEARFLDDGRLQWTMNFAPVIVRYTITLGEGRWNEIGEMSRDNGATWARTLEMNLTRNP